MELRWYQTEAVERLLKSKGNALCVLPTGSGKSLVISNVCQRLLENPKNRIAVTSHLRTVIEQLRGQLPVGVTIETVQTLVRRPSETKSITHLIIDEAHLVPADEDTAYRKLISKCRKRVKVFGLTATPYRTHDGHLLDAGVFSSIAYEAPVKLLCDRDILCPLVSPTMPAVVDMTGVNLVASDYSTSESASVIDEVMPTAIADAVARISDRKSILVFTPTIATAKRAAALLSGMSIETLCVHSQKGTQEVDGALASFKAGTVRALSSVMKIATGFDAPGVDCIIVLRPTLSPGLHVQMLGRGMRRAVGKSDCLVLDYAGNIARHGPIDRITAPPAKNKTASLSDLIRERQLREREVFINSRPAFQAPIGRGRALGLTQVLWMLHDRNAGHLFPYGFCVGAGVKFSVDCEQFQYHEKDVEDEISKRQGGWRGGRSVTSILDDPSLIVAALRACMETSTLDPLVRNARNFRAGFGSFNLDLDFHVENPTKDQCRAVAALLRRIALILQEALSAVARPRCKITAGQWGQWTINQLIKEPPMPDADIHRLLAVREPQKLRASASATGFMRGM